LVGITDNLSNDLSAGDIANFASGISNGKGGGGRKDFAQSGGEYKEDYPLKDKIEEFIKSKI
jgi:alanyl-tRNA synthetase